MTDFIDPKIIQFQGKPRPKTLIDRLMESLPKTPAEVAEYEKFVKARIQDLRQELLKPKVYKDPANRAKLDAYVKKLFGPSNQSQGFFYRKGESQIEKWGDIEFEKIFELPEEPLIIITDIAIKPSKKVEIEFLYKESNNLNQPVREKMLLDKLDDIKNFSVAVGGNEDNRNRLRNLIEPLFDDETLKMKP